MVNEGRTRSEEYQEGLRDGKIAALEEGVARAHVRIDKHESRITAQERISYALLGSLALIQVWPAIERMLS